MWSSMFAPKNAEENRLIKGIYIFGGVGTGERREFSLGG